MQAWHSRKRASEGEPRQGPILRQGGMLRADVGEGVRGLDTPNGGPRGGTSCGPEGWASQGGTAGARTHEGAATDMVTAPCVLKKKSPGVGLLSHELPRSIIGDGGLNFRVRNGIGCTPSSMDARTDSLVTVREGWLCSRRHFVRDRNRIK